MLASPISQTILWASEGLRDGAGSPWTLPGPLPATPHSLLSADILALHGAAQHLAHAHTQPHVLKPQAQVLSCDGQPCSSLSRASLWGQLGENQATTPLYQVPGGGLGRARITTSGKAYLEDLRVSAAATAVASMHPGGGHIGWAVVAQGAAALSHTPATLEAWVGLEAEATALTKGWALVEVSCTVGEGSVVSRALSTT